MKLFSLLFVFLLFVSNSLLLAQNSQIISEEKVQNTAKAHLADFLKLKDDPARYKPLVLEDNKWSVLKGSYDASKLKVCCAETEHIIFIGDTLIDNKNYKKVYKSLDSLGENQQLSGFIREDVSLKKVWYRNLKNQEGLIYNFDVTIGSQVTLMNIELWYPSTYNVAKIDSMKIGSEYHKVITLHAPKWYDERCIEGIGSEYGVLNGNHDLVDDSFGELLCFSNSTTNYTNPRFQTCDKTSFTPLITSTTLDEAHLNKEYSFHVQTTETSNYDKLAFFLSGATWQSGLSINQETGVISGIPTQIGTFPLRIFVSNNGYMTDFIDTYLYVDQNVNNPNTCINQIPKVFPNPAKGFITINYPEALKGARMHIYNSEGKLCLQINCNPDNSNAIDVSSLSDGLYLIKIEDSALNKTIYSEQIIVNKQE